MKAEPEWMWADCSISMMQQMEMCSHPMSINDQRLSNPPFLFFDIQALWHSVLSARMSKIKNGGLNTSMAKCKALTGLAVKGLILTSLMYLAL